MSKTWQKIIVAALIVGGLILTIGFLLWLSPFLLIKNVMSSAYQQLVMASMPRRMAFGVLLIAGTPFILAILRLFSVRAPFLDDVWPPKKLHAFAMVGVYVGAFSVFMYVLTRNQHFMPGQKDYVCVVDYKFFEHDGVCPVHGKPLRPVTPETIELLEGVKKHGPPHESALGSEGPFVDASTGQPAVWFGERDGRLVPYSSPGFDPITAARLEPASSELVARFRQEQQVLQAAQHEADLRAESLRRETARRGTLMAEARNLESRLSSDPGNADLAFRIGEAYSRAGERARAIEAYKKALWLDPGMDRATQAIRRLGATP